MKKLQDFLPLAFVGSLLFPPAGLVAIIYTLRADTYLVHGQISEALEMSEKSSRWGAWACFLGGLLILFTLLGWCISSRKEYLEREQERIRLEQSIVEAKQFVRTQDSILKTFQTPYHQW